MLSSAPSRERADFLAGAILDWMTHEHHSGIVAERYALRRRRDPKFSRRHADRHDAKLFKLVMSCIQHDVHDPQSASPSMTRSHSDRICCFSAIGARWVKCCLR